MFLNIHSQSSSKLHGFASLQELVLNGNEVERGILRGGDVFSPQIHGKLVADKFDARVELEV